MATTKEFRDYVLECLSFLDEVTCKSMMGEYLLYYKGILFGGIYDNRVLVKNITENQRFQLKQTIPYLGAKAMLFLEDLENKEFVKEIILNTCSNLPSKKK
ncbi:MAG: competence protein TfoX [Anaeroplasmataceae bacterium]|nr:competence protein TfoX [Anaeroplasmataceae bacterium]